ncbi:hypothetical protein [Liquorilactobacillus sicerae]|uniref:hypothetical protein n=1 Tax=Liquorilactobacillus sicerae TaxID=1416943 RepID=UPI002480ECA6|nr:hypothetical protein [Liquorilactobacillus sicerae]
MEPINQVSEFNFLKRSDHYLNEVIRQHKPICITDLKHDQHVVILEAADYSTFELFYSFLYLQSKAISKEMLSDKELIFYFQLQLKLYVKAKEYAQRRLTEQKKNQ